MTIERPDRWSLEIRKRNTEVEKTESPEDSAG